MSLSHCIDRSLLPLVLLALLLSSLGCDLSESLESSDRHAQDNRSDRPVADAPFISVRSEEPGYPEIADECTSCDSFKDAYALLESGPDTWKGAFPFHYTVPHHVYEQVRRLLGFNEATPQPTSIPLAQEYTGAELAACLLRDASDATCKAALVAAEIEMRRLINPDHSPLPTSTRIRYERALEEADGIQASLELTVDERVFCETTVPSTRRRLSNVRTFLIQHPDLNTLYLAQQVAALDHFLMEYTRTCLAASGP